jgi:4a-hydroxytetrahydrobiopterin dehydratase
MGQDRRMPRPPRLSPDDVAAALNRLPAWSGGPDGIERTLELPSFRAAAEAIGMIADVAEQLDHHPDLDLRWTRVRVAVVTHSAGGVTDLDLALARRIDALFPPAADQSASGA